MIKFVNSHRLEAQHAMIDLKNLIDRRTSAVCHFFVSTQLA